MVKASAAQTVRVEKNVRQKMDGLALLRALDDRSADAIVLDPQYRAILDKMRYGNEGERQRGRATLRQQGDAEIEQFVHEAARTLKGSAYMFMWLDKFALFSGHYKVWFKRAPYLFTVGGITWDKLLLGMGKRERSQGEYVMIVQKAPTSTLGWSDHRIRDVWPEMQDRERHPHAKPYQLTERLIRAATKRGDLVVDPCAGSYVVLDACQRSGRDFIGCDLAGEI